MSSNYPNPDRVTYTWRCGACAAQAERCFLVPRVGAIAQPVPPEGWRLMGFPPVWYCPVHQLVQILLVDGREVRPGAIDEQ